LAQWEREEISARVAASIPIRAKLGKNTGGKGPFGYHWVEGKIIPNPEEAPVVKRAYQIFLETGKLLTTCNQLKEEGLYSRSKKVYKPTSLKRLLSDTIYKGIRRANYAKSLGNKKNWVLKPEKDWVYTNVQPLVSEEEWDAANKIFEETARRYTSFKTVPKVGRFLFSGILKCQCGEKLYVAPYPSMKIPRYACKKCRLRINEDVIEDNFRNALREVVVAPEQLGGNEDLETELQEKQERLELLKKEQKDVNGKVDVLIDLYGKQVLDQNGFKERYDPIKTRLDNISLEIPRLQAEIDFIKTNEIGKSYVIERATTLASLWDSLSYEARQQVVKELVERIDVGEDSLHFVFFYIPSFAPVEKGSHISRDSWQLPT
jgi:site-specific DNA recombinase